MRIEFIGVSGAGKTYVANKVYRDLIDNGQKVVWPWKHLQDDFSWRVRNMIKGWHVICYSIFHVKWVMRLFSRLSKIVETGKCSLVYLLFSGIYLKYSFQRYDTDSTDTIKIYDEGAVHYIWSIYLRTANKPCIQVLHQFLELFDYPIILYSVEADTQVVANRIMQRGRHVPFMDSRDMQSEIERMKKVQDIIINLIRDNFCKRIEIKYISN